jgi:apolipoprotein N-acyltransferase
MSVADDAREASGKSLKVVLLQNSVDTVFGEPSEFPTYKKYLHQAKAAAEEHPETQLMIWPESVFIGQTPDFVADADAHMEHIREDDLEKLIAQQKLAFTTHAEAMTGFVNGRDGERREIAHIVGTMTWHLRNDRVDTYNSALLLSPRGEVEARYHKMHRVMFGEYIPLGEMFPWIYKLTPMPAGLARGKHTPAMNVAGYKLAPSICFESTVPHLIRRQVRELEARGESPDLLVNMTNDGWFWGSGILDLHYKCAVMRAVEHRRPMLVAANTGFSTAIDPTGRPLAVGPRREVETLAVAVPVYRLGSFYSRFGDLFGILCMTFAGVAAGVGIWNRWAKRPRV